MTREAAGAGAELVCLPEYFSGIATEGARFVPTAFTEARHPILPAFREAARELGLWILLGSLAVTRPDGRVANRSYLIDPSGRIAAKYDKIHLFDVDLGVGKSYRESEDISPGSVATVAETPWGGLGLSVCYDLRFPQLYRALAKAGATMLAVPAAFTRLTGRAHWHVLNRARAIENGCFVLAAAQGGRHENGRETYGHSIVVDPWGQVLAEADAEPGVILAEIDPAAIAVARGRIPSLEHGRRFELSSPLAELARLHAVGGAA